MILSSESDIFLANHSHNQDLLLLQSQVPVSTPNLVYFLERKPDFFALHQTLGLDGKVLIAQQDQKIVGMMNVIYDRVFINGSSEVIAYIGELKLLPQARGSGLADRLMRAAIAQARSALGDSVIVVAAASSQNQVGIKKVRNLSRDGSIDMPELAHLKTWFFPCFLPHFVFRSSAKLHVRRAQSADIPDLWAFWQSRASGKQLARDYTQTEWFQGPRFPQPDPEHWLLLEYQDKLIGMVGLWDQRPLRQIIIPKGPFALRLLPGYRPNQALKVMHGLHFCLDPAYQAFLPFFLHKILQKCHQLGASLFSLGLDKQDPLSLRLPKRWGQSSDMILMGSVALNRFPIQVEMSLG